MDSTTAHTTANATTASTASTAASAFAGSEAPAGRRASSRSMSGFMLLGCGCALISRSFQPHLLLRANVRWHDNDMRRRQRTITVQCAVRLDGFTDGEVTEGGRLRRFGVGLQINLGEGGAGRNQNGESRIFALH